MDALVAGVTSGSTPAAGFAPAPPPDRPAGDGSLAARLNRMMALRVVMVTTLLLSAVWVESISETLPRTNPLYGLIAATYALTVVHALCLRFAPAGEWQVHLQFNSDLLIVSGIVYVTGVGGAYAGFVLLYPLAVLAASGVLSLRKGLLLAGQATLCYAVLLVAQLFGLLEPRGWADGQALPRYRLLNSILVVGLSCAVAGLVGGYMAESLRRVGRELESAAEQVADLREINTRIVESMRSGLLTADAACRVAYVNEVGAQILGRPPGELRRRTLREVFGSPLFEPAAIDARARRRDLARFDTEYTSAEGRRRHLGISVSGLKTSRPRVAGGFLLVFQDLTDIKRLEHELRIKDKLAAVGEMAAYLAHEIRNPLSAISGSAQVLLTEPNISSDQERLLEIIKRESRRLSNTLNQVLLKARPAAPDAPVDLGPLIAQAVELLRNGSEVSSAHRVEFECRGGPHLCLADPDPLVQVFWNLARNGLEAMPAGGTLHVGVDTVAGQVVLSVRDDGPGIAREEQARLFEPFRSGHAKGTGLGLAITYRIVKQHQGDIDVHSEPGHGTEFRVRLPLVMVAAPAVS